MMITKKQFLEGVAVLRNSFNNVTVEQMTTWYPHFQQWEPEIFRMTIMQAPLTIDFLSVKSLYDLADRIWKEREDLALRTASSMDVGVDQYGEQVELFMDGWGYPGDRSAIHNYRSDDPLKMELVKQERELEAALEEHRQLIS